MTAALVAGSSSVFGAQFAAAEVVKSEVAAVVVPAAPITPAPVVPPAIKTTSKPKISGKVAVGSKLTAVKGKWSPKVKFSYQWLAAGRSIKKATKSTFKVTKSQIGKQVSVRVTGKLDDARTSRTSAATAKVMKSATAKLTGTIAVGSTIKAARGSWTSKAKVSFQWLRDGKPIAGAKWTTYKVSLADAGRKLTVKLTGKRSGYVTTTTTSAAVVVPWGSTPTILGTAGAGFELTANPSVWPIGTDLSYQWYASKVAIKGATAATFKLTTAEVNQTITVAVTGRKAGNSPETRTSAATAQVMLVSTPTITGTIAGGSTVTASPGTWTAAVSFSYQWLRNGTAIPGATTSTFVLTAADVAQQLSVTVTGVRTGYATVPITSAASKVGYFPLQAGVPVITGTPKVGETLTANPGTWTAGANLKFQWFADGVAIRPDTARPTRGLTNTLRPGYLEAGRKLTVAVTGSKDSYETVQASSGFVSIPTDAVYQVGVDLPAGVYTALDASTGCSWWRLSRVDGNYLDAQVGSEGVLGKRGFTKGQALATVNDSDAWFASAGCGAWTVPAQTLATHFGDGDFLISKQLQSGYYRTTTAKAGCKWELAYSAEGTLTSPEIQETFTASPGQTSAEFGVFAGIVRVSSENCGTWEMVANH